LALVAQGRKKQKGKKVGEKDAKSPGRPKEEKEGGVEKRGGPKKNGHGLGSEDPTGGLLFLGGGGLFSQGRRKRGGGKRSEKKGCALY